MQPYLTLIFLGNSLQSWLYFGGIIGLTLLLNRFAVHTVLTLIDWLSHRSKLTTDEQLISSLLAPMRLAVYSLGIKISFALLVVAPWFEKGVAVLIETTMLLSIFWILHNLVYIPKNLIRLFGSNVHKPISEDVAEFIAKGIKIFIWAIAFMTIMQAWGYDVSAFVASLGLGGLALALAAKDTAANLFGSLVIYTDHPFGVGDWIQTPDVEGTIESIGIRSTRVRTFAQALVTVPNAQLANAAIINWSRMGKRRISTTLGLTYSTTQAQLDAIITQLRTFLEGDPAVHPETIFVYFSGFGASALEIFCYFFTHTTAWGEHMQEKERILGHFMRIIAQNGASFAFPTQTVHLVESKSASID